MQQLLFLRTCWFCISHLRIVRNSIHLATEVQTLHAMLRAFSLCLIIPAIVETGNRFMSRGKCHYELDITPSNYTYSLNLRWGLSAMTNSFRLCKLYTYKLVKYIHHFHQSSSKFITSKMLLIILPRRYKLHISHRILDEEPFKKLHHAGTFLKICSQPVNKLLAVKGPKIVIAVFVKTRDFILVY
jgi:hypothetical protein